VTKIWWSTNWWNQNLTRGEYLVTKICNPIMPWSKLDSELVWPNFYYFSNWQSKLVIKLCCCQNLVTRWKETMLCDFAIKYYLTTEVCAIEIMSPTCVSDFTIMLSIPRVQTLMSIVANWLWGLKFASQLLQLEFSICKKLVAPVGNKFQSRHNLVIKYKNSKSIVSDWLTLDCNLIGGNVKS